MIHDLISFPGARISLTAINAIVDDTDDDGKHTGSVHIHYGPYNAGLAFRGSEADVMEIIDAWCAAQAARLAPGVMSQDEFRKAVGI